ncbi:M48 family metallopeptidase [Cerasicoccus arenae]|uniref:Zn-dependent protease n=1 Tax=Cerasicoccus arenae TaxID=424488 RepID=A0A8J3DAV7_9BACT|nr:M48 family metallopeptidase [Cerasicoccus arenae]MBK1858699.1 M48 family metallopeptidase [Cerasicoccus arenae]GHB98386.1 Zn-dependent protease [Cerasicoccus arenae]
MEISQPIVSTFIAGLAIAWLTGCSTVSETGRSQLSLVSDAEVESMAVSQFDQMKHEMPIANDPAKQQALRRVGEKIVRAARAQGADLLPPEQWEFVLFDSDQVNAFAMPGGKVGFYTGIFPLFQSDDDIAVVMGHEIAHVSADHGAEKVSQQMANQVAGTALSIGLGVGGVEHDTQQIVMASYGMGSNFGFILPFSRTMESEADHIGLLYSSTAGYDPRASVPFWQRMAANGGERPPEFLSTHPSENTRIARLQELIPEMLPLYYKASGQTQNEWLGPVAPHYAMND